VQVAQYLASQTCTDDATGDPALVMAVSASQYRMDYVFAVPKDYKSDYISLVKPADATLTLDGEVVPDSTFSEIGGTGIVTGYVKIEDGPHSIEGDMAFGLYQYGFSGPASYGNPGGLNLLKKQ